MSSQLKAFAAEYHRLKTPRKLVWKPALGSVLVAIQAGATSEELRVSPSQVPCFPPFPPPFLRTRAPPME